MIAQGGSIIQNVRSDQNPGTFGCLVRRFGSGDTLFVLSAAHVLALNGHAVRGDDVIVVTNHGSEKIAEYETLVPMRASAGSFQVCDAAIARVTHTDRVHAVIGEFGVPKGIATSLYRAKRLKLFGARSGAIVDAAVHSTGADVRVDYPGYRGGAGFSLAFRGQILYGKLVAGSHDAQRVTLPGDSGALVVDQYNLAVGLHIASTPHDYPIDASVCTPMERVLAALDLELVTEANLQLRGSDLNTAATPAEAGDSAPRPSPTVSGTVSPSPATVIARAATNTDRTSSERSVAALGRTIDSLLVRHGIFDSVKWQLTSEGLLVGDGLDGTAGPPVTVERVWREHERPIRAAASKYQTPVELILATICTESSGKQNPPRREPGWKSDDLTPHRVSHGLMQTLLSTAREALDDPRIALADLDDPQTSINAGTAYIAAQGGRTLFDPPVVACAYNAGGIYNNDSATNRWKMRQYPIGTSHHADRFVAWFNDCFEFFEVLSRRGSAAAVPQESLFRILRG